MFQTFKPSVRTGFFKTFAVSKKSTQNFCRKTPEQESHPPLGIRLDSPPLSILSFFRTMNLISFPRTNSQKQPAKKRNGISPQKEEEPMKNEKKPFEKRELGIKKGGGGRETTVKMILPHLRT